MKTVSIIGNRPQLVKLIPELADVVLWTGQHYSDALKGAYTKQLDLCSDIVDLGRNGMADIIQGIQCWLRDNKTERVVVYGDTTSTFAGALAAQYEFVKQIIHVEAGLRCGNETMPEERNRVTVDALSYVNFCPTVEAQANLVYEWGVNIMNRSPIVGDIMQERLYDFWHDEMGRQIPTEQNNKWICTIHRAENSDEATYKALCKNIAMYVEEPRLYLHPKAERLFRWSEQMRLRTINAAIPYRQIMRELWNCAGVITDSGGLLREAAWLGKKCIVLRNECEFPELVEAKRIKLVGRDEEALRDALESSDWGNRVELENPHTTDKILEHLNIERRFYDGKEPCLSQVRSEAF